MFVRNATDSGLEIGDWRLGIGDWGLGIVRFRLQRQIRVFNPHSAIRTRSVQFGFMIEGKFKEGVCAFECKLFGNAGTVGFDSARADD